MYQPLGQGFLTFCSIDPFESLVKPTDPFSEKCIEMDAIGVSFVEVNQHFWSLDAINYFVACIQSM